jgi:dihydroflavonol-4-reductase
MYVRGWMPPLLWGRDCRFSFVHVEDLARAMLLAADTGRPGESYIMSGGTATMREVIEYWAETPGGFKRPIWVGRSSAYTLAMLMEPVLRGLGWPAFVSREGVTSIYAQYSYTADKARRELGAGFRDPRQTWHDTLAAERELVKTRRWTISPQ